MVTVAAERFPTPFPDEALLFTVAFVVSVVAGQTAELATPMLPPLVFDGVPAAARGDLQRAYDAALASPRDPAAVGSLARRLHAYQQYRSAEVCYRLVRQLDPEALQWTYLAGVVQMELGEHAEAARMLRLALTIDPAYVPARLRLADALMHVGELDASRDAYRALLQSAPGLAPAHYGVARASALLGDPRGALDHYRRATELSPEFGAAHYALAMVYRRAGRASDADVHLAEYRRWGARRPAPPDPILEDVQALNGTARELLAQAAQLGKAGRLDEAIELHVKALEADPAAAQAHVNLISLYGRKGQVDSAEEHYRAALKLGTNLADAHYNYGVLLAGAGRYGDAAAAFRQAVGVNPFHPEAHNNLAALLARDGDLDQAAVHYRQAISNSPSHTMARVNLARVLVALGRPAEARDQYEQALRRASLEAPELAGKIDRELQQLVAVR